MTFTKCPVCKILFKTKKEAMYHSAKEHFRNYYWNRLSREKQKALLYPDPKPAIKFLRSHMKK
jgi:uncharacterized C2H2 Zn-finger protein